MHALRSTSLGPLEPSGSDAMFTVVPALIGLVFVAIIGITIYRAVRMANRGQNPLTLQEDLAHQVSRSGALAGPRSKADRLAELDSLRSSGSISDAEHAEARARILAE